MTEAFRPTPPGADLRTGILPEPAAQARNLDLDRIEIVSGRSNPDLARRVGEILGLEVDDTAADDFFNKEVKVKIHQNLRNRDVYIIQSTANNEDRSVNDHVIELLALVDAAKLGSADKVTGVVPHYGYARQDKKDDSRVPISAALIARIMVTAGVDRIFTLDLHAEQTMGTIAPKPWDNLYASRVLLPAVQELELDDPMVVASDVGAGKRARKFSKLLNGHGRIAIVNKEREDGGVEAKEVIGDVNGRDLVLVDDMIDTAGTLQEATRILKDEGANRIVVVATHGIFSGPAMERIEDSPIDLVIVTDTITQPDEIKNHPKIEIVTAADLIAQGIRGIHTGESLSQLIPR